MVSHKVCKSRSYCPLFSQTGLSHFAAYNCFSGELTQTSLQLKAHTSYASDFKVSLYCLLHAVFIFHISVSKQGWRELHFVEPCRGHGNPTTITNFQQQ